MFPAADQAVDWGQLLEVVWTSVVGGIGVTTVFAIALYGAVKTMDVRQGGQGVAVAYAAMTVVASAVVLGSIVFAITTITG